MPWNGTARGFTLLELMITLAVLGIVLALGVPAFSQVFEERTSSALPIMLPPLRWPRRDWRPSRGATPVSVCPSRDGLHCRRRPGLGGGLDHVFGPIAQASRPASAGDVLQHATPGPRGVAVRSTVGRTGSAYQPSGLSRGSNLSLCDLRPPRIAANSAAWS